MHHEVLLSYKGGWGGGVRHRGRDATKSTFSVFLKSLMKLNLIASKRHFSIKCSWHIVILCKRTLNE